MQGTTMAVRRDSLELVTGVGGPLEAVTARPIIAPKSFNPHQTIADYTADFATFAGSTPILIVWGATADAPNDQPFQSSQLLQWIASADPASPETVYGVVYYLAGAPNVLLGYDALTEPVVIEQAFDSVSHITTAP